MFSLLKSSSSIDTKGLGAVHIYELITNEYDTCFYIISNVNFIFRIRYTRMLLVGVKPVVVIGFIAGQFFNFFKKSFNLLKPFTIQSINNT